MKTLLLLRHGKSSWDDEGLDDHERPLAKRGKEAAKRIGRLLAGEALVPDLIVSSTAVRARKTAQKVAKQSGYEHAIELSDQIYLANVAAHLAAVHAIPEDRQRALVVGHNPGLSEFLHQLAANGEEMGDREEMPTGALAVIELPIKRWSALSEKTRGKLVKLWKPQELD